MLRSLYSGVAGMKVHQARMDVVGNNISNVNTYGFKASRATFSDLYYQTLSGASGGSSTTGGTNPSQIGYGVQFSGVDTLMDRAAFSSTDRTWDVAIAGDGFFQVQDGEGNIFYTRAGILQVDVSGNLVDGNGNYILGISGNPVGRGAASEKIQFQIPAVTPNAASATEVINNNKFTITASNKTEAGNVTFRFASDDTLPGGQKVKAEISSAGITIKLNANETFYTMTELNSEINRAITEANGGKTHPSGTFTITTEPVNIFPGTSAIKGAIDATIPNTPGGLVGFPADIFGGVTYQGVSANFSGVADVDNVTFSATFVPQDGTITYERWEITASIDGSDYSGYVIGNNDQVVNLTRDMGGGKIEYIKIHVNGGVAALKSFATPDDPVNPTTYTIPDFATGISSSESQKLFGGFQYTSVSQPFSGNGEVSLSAIYVAVDDTAKTPEGWEITATVGSMTYKGIVGVNDISSGIIRLRDAATGEYIEFRHPGVAVMNEASGFYSADPSVTIGVGATMGMPADGISLIAAASSPFIGSGLTGAEIVSNDFSTQPGVMSGVSADSGVFGGLQFMTTSKGFVTYGDSDKVEFNAVYVNADSATSTPEGWKITATVGEAPNSTDYVGYISTTMTSANSFMLKNASGEYIQMSHPGILAFNEKAGVDNPLVGGNLNSLNPAGITITGSKKSQALGLSSKDIALSGGTEGGTQTMADLTNLSISPDGVIEATHAVHGRIQLGQICLATFENPMGLEQSGNTYFIATSNSGTAKLAEPGTSGTGSLVTSALEMSNVDLSKEFTEMITTQRGFQANSRIITVSDTLLEELINLKR